MLQQLRQVEYEVARLVDQSLSRRLYDVTYNAFEVRIDDRPIYRGRQGAVAVGVSVARQVQRA